MATWCRWESPRAPLSAARRDVLSALRHRAHYSVRYVCASSGEAGRAQPTPRTPSPPRRARIPARRARQNRRLGADTIWCLWLTQLYRRGKSTGEVAVYDMEDLVWEQAEIRWHGKVIYTYIRFFWAQRNESLLGRPVSAQGTERFLGPMSFQFWTAHF